MSLARPVSTYSRVSSIDTDHVDSAEEEGAAPSPSQTDTYDSHEQTLVAERSGPGSLVHDHSSSATPKTDPDNISDRITSATPQPDQPKSEPTVSKPVTTHGARSSQIADEEKLLNHSHPEKIPFWSRQRWWPQEIVCWFLSLALFGSIVAVLAVYDGHISPSLYGGITLNALISVLATIAIVFLTVPIGSSIGQIKWLRLRQSRRLEEFRALDEASKTAWGSLRLLVAAKGGALAMFGALLVILILAIGPFVQQLASQTPHYKLIGTNASMPIAKSFLLPTRASQEQSQLLLLDIPQSFKATFYDGIFSDASSRYAVTPHCSTGNCTIPNYKSLGFCNSCYDVTNLLQVSGSTANLPNLVSLDTTEVASTNSTGQFQINSTFTYFIVEDGITNQIPPPIAPLFNFSAISWRQWQGLPPMAVSCTLQLCFQEYATNVTNGKATETLLGTNLVQTIPEDSQNPYDRPSFIALGDWLQRVLQVSFIDRVEVQGPAPRTGNSKHKRESDTSGNTSPTDERHASSDGFSSGNSPSSDSSSSSLSSSQSSSSNSDSSSGDSENASGPGYSFLLADNSAASFNIINSSSAPASLPESESNQDIARTIWESMAPGHAKFNVSDLFDNLAASLTFGMRSGGVGNVSVARGPEYAYRSFVHVTWGWIALPAALQVLVLVLLLVVIFQTDRHKMGMWRDDILAPLIFGFDDAARKGIASGVREHWELDRAIEDVYVELVDDSEGLRMIASKRPATPEQPRPP